MTDRMHLGELVRALGWSYAALWSMPDNTTEQLVFADGSYEANPLTGFWNVETLFMSAYKSCCFSRGSGYAGKVLAEHRPIWLNGTDELSLSWSNSGGQAQFFKVAGIQTVLCLPWFNSVVELGSSNLEPQNANLMVQIQTFLSQMPTSQSTKQQQQQQVVTNSHPLSQALSNGSDDASFNGGAHHDQQVDSGSSLPHAAPLSQQVPRPGGRNLFAAVGGNASHEKHLSGSGESNWALNFHSKMLQRQQQQDLASPQSATSAFQMLQQQQQDLASPQSATSAFQMQQPPQQLQLPEGGWTDGASGFDESSYLISPRQQLPLLGQLNYNQSISSSLSSSKSDNDDHLTDSNGNQRSSLEKIYRENSIGSAGGGMINNNKPGFAPWNSAHQRNFAGALRKKSRTNQAMLQRAINMTHQIPHHSAAVSDHRQQSMTERPSSSGPPASDMTTHYAPRAADMTTDYAARVNDVLTGHDEAALHHMLAERKRRQKQKENFTALRSLIPFVSKMDRASILEDAIRYVKELTSRVEELEASNRELEAQIPLSQRKRNKSSMSL